ncbi:MAG: hypothetical protein HUK24_00750 [Sphaerochaetaceae bacterium]|nr:hypothetical protein [Sphaerochaetaceae bacterium]
MVKALFKKQLLELSVWATRDNKTGKRKSKKKIIITVIGYILLTFGYIGAMIFLMGRSLCAPLISIGYGWLYFSIMGGLALTLGLFGSAFTICNSLYNAKDNDMLLSLPIPPLYILIARLFGAWFWSSFYILIIYLPTLLVFWVEGFGSFTNVILQLLSFFPLSFFVTALSCLLGWVVAKASAKLKNNSFVKTFLILIFIGLYYVIYFKAMNILTNILTNAQGIGKSMTYIYPLYALGQGAMGNVGHFFGFTALSFGLFGIIAYFMSNSFIKIATTKTSTTKKVYKEKKVNKKSVEGALLYRELKRFTNSSLYMVNCGLGIIFLLVCAVFCLIKASAIKTILDLLPKDLVSIIACAAICVMSDLIDITAPSVSLEGKSLWLIKSLPVDTMRVLKGKLNLHRIFASIPTLLLSISLAFVIKPSLFDIVALIVVPQLFIILMSSVGLVSNLKAPNLTWIDESVPIKQGMSVAIALFGGWVFIGLLVGLYFISHKFLGPKVFIGLCAVLMAIASYLLDLWIFKKGTKIFEAL